MKIYRSVTISMRTGEVLHEDSYEYDGPIAKCFGSSGEVSYPIYMETQHEAWLDDMDLLVQADLSGNSPYYNQTAYDPDPVTALNYLKAASFQAIVSALDPQTNWEDAVTAVVAKMQAALPDSTAIATAVDQRAVRLAPAHQRSIGRLASSYGDINAYNHSGFFMALAALEVDLARDLEDFDTKLTVVQEQVRLSMISEGVKLLLQGRDAKINASHAEFQTYLEMNRQHAIMFKEEVDKNIQLSALDAGWDYEVLAKAGGLLGSIGGGVGGSSEPSPVASALSGAATAASIAAAIPGVGPLAVAGIAAGGALLGLADALL